jgi:two-component system secretion sensor histidine kinase SsrA
MNIGGNAVKFTDAGCVELRVYREDRWAVIDVRDTGCGIAKEDVALVTTEFFRSDEVRPKPGSGLGLAISERLVRLLGGSLSIESELGVGTQVAIRLPLSGEGPQEHLQQDCGQHRIG